MRNAKVVMAATVSAATSESTIIAPLREGGATLAHTLHADQLDKQHRSYLTHHVAVVAHTTPTALSAARSSVTPGTGILLTEHELGADGVTILDALLTASWLHDSVEDTTMTLQGLRREGVHPIAVRAIGSVTRDTYGPRPTGT